MAEAQRIFESIETLLESLERHHYVTDRALATVIYLAHHMKKPLFLEGEPGVGKTEVALVLSRMLQTRLIRLQCYEGLDAASALYEWNYPKQLLRIRMEEQCRKDPEEIGQVIYTEQYLIKRPLLEAIQSSSQAVPVLLIDELDRADEEFEAFLLEVLSDFQISIPELGTLKATHRPMVVLTSNRTREIHDALKRRCLYHWIDYPDPEKELRIVRARVPGIEDDLAKSIVRFVQRLRQEDLFKRPGISETLDWAEALLRLNRSILDAKTVDETLGCLLKYREDIHRFRTELWSDPEARGQLLKAGC
ncbi:MAG: AAA family ATPase [Thermodesulfobacteriota bacterium]